MALIGNIAIGMSTNTAAFSQGLNRARGELGSFQQSIGTSLSGAFAGLGAGLAALGIGKVLYDGVKGASDLNETLSKTGVIFGDSASIITAEADKMASSFGTAKTEFITAAGNFGAVFKGVGKSQQDAAKMGNTLAKIGMDMASMDNTSNEEAFTAISSALRGEMDPIEKFRVFLSADKIAAEALAMGLVKTKGEMTDMAKKTAIVSLIMKQTADAQGDLERTSGGAANQFRKVGGTLANMATDIGAIFLPAVTAGAVAMNDFFVAGKSAFTGVGDMVTPFVDAVVSGFTTISVMIRNAGSVWEIMKIKADESVQNVSAIMATLPANFTIITNYLGDNWQNLLIDMVSAYGVYVENVLTNAVRFGKSVWDAMQGKGFTFEFKPLLDGFQAASEALPELVKPAWVSLQADIDKIGEQIASKEIQRAEATASAMKEVAKPGAIGTSAGVEASGQRQDKFAAVAELGSKEAYSAIIKAQNAASPGRDAAKDTAKTVKEQLAETRKQTLSLAEIARKSGGLAAYTF